MSTLLRVGHQFHDRTVVASLKQDNLSARHIDLVEFHDRTVVASLKLNYGLVDATQGPEFHDRTVVASLKQLSSGTPLMSMDQIPRPHGRGLIEATG